MAGIADSLGFLLASSDFTEIGNGPDYALDLRYNSANNFVGRDMYGSFNRAFLHRLAAEKLEQARRVLKQVQPGFKFLIYDALRPRSVQRILWSHVVGTENEKYIANPDLGSLHNFGFAIDLSLLNESGEELDMGAGYDDFRPIAQPQLESQFIAQGLLTPEQMQNRLLLRSCMESGGFKQLPHEWWHFDALPKAEVRQRFQIVE